jgi:hypothetical protein
MSTPTPSLATLFRSSALTLSLLAACAPSGGGGLPGSAAAGANASAPLAWVASAHAAPATAPSAPALDPAQGGEIGMVFESFLSPHQEPDEEENTPATTPKVFRSTGPSMSRAAREAAGHRGHGRIRFSKDLSRAFIDVRVEGIKASTVNMFHIHCGKPGILGPILVDFAQATNIQENLADGLFSVEIRNEHIAKTVEHGHGLIGALTAGCLINSPSLGIGKPSKVSTVSGMAQIALEGELYFNLHTVSQTYFGDIRGQIYAAHPAEKSR